MTDAMMAAVLVARAGRFLTTVTLVIGITGRAALFFGLFSGLKSRSSRGPHSRASSAGGR